MTATTKLTKNEQAVLRACYASEYASGQSNPSPWSWSVTEHSGLSKRSVAGVVASLVKKNIVTSYGEGTKDDDNYISVTDAGFKIAKSLGMIVEEQGNFGPSWTVANETSAPMTDAENAADEAGLSQANEDAAAAEIAERTKPAAKKTTKRTSTKSRAPEAKRARKIIRNYLRASIYLAFALELGDEAEIEAATETYELAHAALSTLAGYEDTDIIR